MQNFLQRDLGSSLLSIAVILGWIGLLIVIILKKTKNKPIDPKITAIDSKLEPRSRCRKFCINFKINRFNSILIT